ncbi:MAG: hypothetical protein ACFB6R_11465 [Alphaproteobacteria bacterium]
MRQRFSSFAAFIGFGQRRARLEWWIMAFPLTIYALLVGVFASIFAITPFEELGKSDASGITGARMVWYVAITECVALATAGSFRDMRDIVLTGEYAASLHRPVSLMVLKTGEWIGRLSFDLPVFCLAATGLGLFFTGLFPFGPVQALFLGLSLMLSTLLLHWILAIVGLVEVWGPYGRPVYWIVQKVLFLLGGLILPIALYPQAIAAAAWLTPFPAILTIPGRIAFDPAPAVLVAGVAIQLFWLGVVGALLAAVQTRANRIILWRGY